MAVYAHDVIEYAATPIFNSHMLWVEITLTRRVAWLPHMHTEFVHTEVTVLFQQVPDEQVGDNQTDQAFGSS